jgi:hypothetical protein
MIGTLPATVRGMSLAEYLSAVEFRSRSQICAAMTGGGFAQRWLDQGYSIFAGNAATQRGSEFDRLVTEGLCLGKRIDDMLAVAPRDVLGSNGARNTKAYREWAETATGIVVTEEQAWQYKRMCQHMLEHRAARQLIDETSETQLSVFSEINGFKVKVRPDAVTPSLWWDLKTTSQMDRLPSSVRSYHYGEQAWLYQQVAYTLGMDEFRMPFVFVSTQPPYQCEVYRLPVDYVEECGERVLATLELMELRHSTREYLPLDHGEIKELAIPAWARINEEVY